VTIRFKTDGLDKLIKATGNETPVGRVGILRKAARSDSSLTNADIGIKHEFGEEGMPIRSFLRVPITDNLMSYLKDAKVDEQVMMKVVEEEGLAALVEKITITAQKIVLDAFDNGGFGKWPPSNMKNKKNKQTLVETQQLRNSIEWDVIK